jgi:hypothetical protein
MEICDMFSDDFNDFFSAFVHDLDAKHKNKKLNAIEYARAFESANEKSPKDFRSEFIVWLQRAANYLDGCKCDSCFWKSMHVRLAEYCIRKEVERPKPVNEQ